MEQKNSALKLLTASILTEEKIDLMNYPAKLLDAQIHVGMLEALGKKCIINDEKIVISEKEVPSPILDWSKRSIRNTLLILGALVSRIGEAKVPLPGGCDLGERKFDLHEMILTNMGAKVWVENDMLCAKAEDGLKGTDIFLPIRSTGATENAIICGCLAEGITKVWNPHIRPEILDLINFLNKMGAKIQVFGQEHIEITGVEKLYGVKYSVIPDNMEAITWLIAAVITGGDIEIINFPFRDLEVPLIHLRESGAKYYIGDNSLIVRGGTPYPIEISTGLIRELIRICNLYLLFMAPVQKVVPKLLIYVSLVDIVMQVNWPKWACNIISTVIYWKSSVGIPLMVLK